MTHSESTPTDPTSKSDLNDNLSLRVEVEHILSSMKSIVLAGGYFTFCALLLFGAIQLLHRAMTGGRFGTDVAMALCMLLLYALIGFAVGCMAFFITGAVSIVLVLLIHLSTQRRFHPRTLVQIAGGMAGFGAVAMAFAVLIDQRVTRDISSYLSVAIVLAVVAMLFGQRMTATAYQREWLD